MAYTEFQQRRINAGLCKDCGKERSSSGTTVFCRPCADRHKDKQAKRKKRLQQEWRQSGAFVCNGCGTELPDSSYKRCARCLAYNRKTYARSRSGRHERKVAAGLCVLCTGQALHPSRYCRLHILDNTLRKYGIPKACYEAFWSLLEAQEFSCYYTGLPLVPGVNASLDHRTPVSRGGNRTDIDNCVWCDRQINAFKNDLTVAEFVGRCRAVVDRLG